MSDRFFVTPPVTSDHVKLKDAEAHHLKHVLRAQPGQLIQLFDGSGQEYSARISGIDRREITLQILDRTMVDRELSAPLVIGTAFPKGERQRWLVEKLVELGVTELIPLRTSRSVVHPTRHGSAKLRRTVIEASKQCGRNRLMAVAELQEFESYLQTVPSDARRVLADPGGSSLDEPDDDARATYLAIGPEGGFTEQELTAASAAGWQIVSLGGRVLRIETACLALAARTASTKK